MSTDPVSLPPLGSLYDGFYFGTMLSTALYGVTCMQMWVLIILECIVLKCMPTLLQILLLCPVSPMSSVLIHRFTCPHPSYQNDSMRVKIFVSQVHSDGSVMVTYHSQVAVLW